MLEAILQKKIPKHSQIREPIAVVTSSKPIYDEIVKIMGGAFTLQEFREVFLLMIPYSYYIPQNMPNGIANGKK